MSSAWTVVLRGDWYLPHLVNMLREYCGNNEQNKCRDEMVQQIEAQMMPVGGSVIKATRALAVIDFENREQVERLLVQYCTEYGDGTTYEPNGRHQQATAAMQAALREFANPTPKVEEPLGLGAVIETNDGRRFVRVAGRDSRFPWVDAGKPADNAYNWVSHGGLDGATPLRAVNEGVAVHG